MHGPTDRQWRAVLSKALALVGATLASGACVLMLVWLLVGGAGLARGTVLTGLLAGGFLGPAVLLTVSASLLEGRDWRYILPAFTLEFLALAVPFVYRPSPHWLASAGLTAAATGLAVAVGALLVVGLTALVEGRSPRGAWLPEWARAGMWISLVLGAGLALMLVVGAAVALLG